MAEFKTVPITARMMSQELTKVLNSEQRQALQQLELLLKLGSPEDQMVAQAKARGVMSGEEFMAIVEAGVEYRHAKDAAYMRCTDVGLTGGDIRQVVDKYIK